MQLAVKHTECRIARRGDLEKKVKYGDVCYETQDSGLYFMLRSLERISIGLIRVQAGNHMGLGSGLRLTVY